jgi:hypothetical protein
MLLHLLSLFIAIVLLICANIVFSQTTIGHLLLSLIALVGVFFSLRLIASYELLSTGVASTIFLLTLLLLLFIQNNTYTVTYSDVPSGSTLRQQTCRGYTIVYNPGAAAKDIPERGLCIGYLHTEDQ